MCGKQLNQVKQDKIVEGICAFNCADSKMLMLLELYLIVIFNFMRLEM